MFLTEAYFQGDLYLPNLVTTKPEAVGVGRMVSAVAESDLSYYVDKYEREFLRLLLGDELYDAFIAGLEEPDNARWLALKDKIYDTTGSYPLSPAANYVYYMLISHNVTATTMKGEVVPEQDYAKNASSKRNWPIRGTRYFRMPNVYGVLLTTISRIYGQYVICRTCHQFLCYFAPVNIFGI